ncbi:hypothetical protein ACJX0J_026405, partial [Zea mays]
HNILTYANRLNCIDMPVYDKKKECFILMFFLVFVIESDNLREGLWPIRKRAELFHIRDDNFMPIDVDVQVHFLATIKHLLEALTYLGLSTCGPFSPFLFYFALHNASTFRQLEVNF